MPKDEIQIYATGDSQNKPIVFIHGFPYDHHMWNKQVNELDSLFYCITYDIRGLGASPAGDGQFTLESFVDDLEFVLDEFKLNKPVLCGLSMGGYIALRSMERMEDKFSGVIFCDTKSEADTNEVKLKRAGGIKTINKEGVQKFVSGFVPGCFSEGFIHGSTKEYNEILGRALNSGSIGVKGCLLAMQGRTDTTPHLSKIQIPSLVLCGEEDKLSPPEVMKKLAEKVRNSEFVTIPGAGHMSPIENAVFFNKVILSFIKKNFS